jgi:hypothetical protein
MDIRRTFTTPTKNSYASDYIKNKRSKVIFSGTSNLANTIVEQGGMFPLVTSSGHLKPYQGTFGFSSATQTSGAPPSSYCLNQARSYHDLLDITRGKYLLTPPNATTTIIEQLSDINFSTQLFCGSLYQNGNTGVAESIIFNNSISGGVTGPTGASNKIIYNPATTANQWIKVDPSYNMLNNGNSCESENNSVLNNATVRTNIQAQKNLDRYLNLDVQGFKYPVKFSMYYDSSDCINSNNDLQMVENRLSFTSLTINKLITSLLFDITNFVFLNSPAPVIYTSSNPSVATIVGNIVTIVGLGTTTITATQSASINNIYPLGVATVQLVVTLVTPVLSAFRVDSRNVRSEPFTLTSPTSNSSGAFSYASSNTAVASIAGDVVTIVGAGTTTITATQAATTDYTSKTIAASFVVIPIAPTLSAFTVASKDFGSVPFTLTSPTSNSSGAFSYESSNRAVASIAGDVVTIVGAGTTTIRATQVAAGIYASGTIDASFVVNPIAPTLTAFTVASKDFGSAPFTLTSPTSNSSGAFSYESSNLSVASIAGDVVTIVVAGSSTITARQAATTNYTAGAITASLVVNPIDPTLTAFKIVSKDFGSVPFTLTSPTSNSSGTYNYESSNLAVASIAGDMVTIVGAGTTTIKATQVATTNYKSKIITDPFVVNPIAPTLTAFTIASKDFGSVPFTLTSPTSNSSGAFSYESSNRAVASITGDVVTIVGAGTTTITATQAATTNYTSKTITASLVVNPIDPTLTAFTIASKDFGSVPFTLTSPTSNSSGAYNYESSNPAVASIAGDVVTIMGAGSSTITARQAATTNYKSKAITDPFVVNPIAPIFGAFTITSKDFGSVPFTLTSPTSNSSGAFSYESSNLAVATILGSIVTIVGAGTTDIKITQAATTNYTSKTITTPFVVNPIDPTLTAFTIASKDFGSVPFTLTSPTSNSSGAFTYESSNPSVATILGSIVTIVGAGTTDIKITQAATTNYKSKTITASFVVNPIAPTLTAFTIASRNVISVPFTLTPPTSNSSGAFSYESSNINVATITGNTVTIVGVGSTTITARQAVTTNYTSNTITTSFVVTPVSVFVASQVDTTLSLTTMRATNSSGDALIAENIITFTAPNNLVNEVRATIPAAGIIPYLYENVSGYGVDPSPIGLNVPINVTQVLAVTRVIQPRNIRAVALSHQYPQVTILNALLPGSLQGQNPILHYFDIWLPANTTMNVIIGIFQTSTFPATPTVTYIRNNISTGSATNIFGLRNFVVHRIYAIDIVGSGIIGQGISFIRPFAGGTEFTVSVRLEFSSSFGASNWIVEGPDLIMTGLPVMTVNMSTAINPLQSGRSTMTSISRTISQLTLPNGSTYRFGFLPEGVNNPNELIIGAQQTGQQTRYTSALLQNLPAPI